MSSNTPSAWTRVGAVGAAGLATFGLIALLGAPTDAQSAANEAEAASATGVATPIPGTNTQPSVSSNGSVVVFSNSGGTQFAHAIVIRDRDVDATAVFDAGPSPSAAAVSANGCIVAYSVVVDAPPPPTTTSTTSSTSTTSTTSTTAPPAATVVELRILDRCVSAAIAVQPTVLATLAGSKTLPQPALSADGDIVVVSTGTGVLRFSDVLGAAPVTTEIDGVNDGDVTGPHVDVSSNGATVAFDSSVAGVSNVYTWTAAAGTVLLSSAAGTPATPAAGSSSWPTLSGDGNLVGFQNVVGSAAPSVIVADRQTGNRVTIATDATRPTLATDGRSIIYDAAGAVRVARSDTTMPFTQITERIVSRAVTGLFESVGPSLTGATISADGTLAVFDSAAGAELTTDAAFAAAGHVWVRDTAPIFTPPTTTTLAPPTVASTAVTTVAPTTPRTTRVVRTIPPRTTTRRTVPATTRATTTTTAVPRPATFDPAAFEFAPTIVDAGRRTADIELVNPSAVPITVIDVAIEPATGSAFAIETSTCAGVLPTGARCVITVSFAPTQTGDSTANIVARFDNDTTATSAISGLGADSPVIQVRPGVASDGQVVTVFGFGFPAGASVELSWHDGLVERSIDIDDLGEFVETLVVLPNTRRGPSELTVAGQPDAFGNVTTELLITNSPDRSPSAVLPGPLDN